MGEMSEQEKYLYELAKKNRRITNFHQSDDFLTFWDLFYSDERDVYAVRQRFNYYANKLVQRGILKHAIRMGLGAGAMNEFGTRTQTYWEVNE